MKKLFLGLLTVFIFVGIFYSNFVQADNPKTIRMSAVLCKKLEGDEPIDPTTQFPKNSPAVYGAWYSPDLKEGQTLKTIWIAEDVGKVSPPNVKIDETKMVLNQNMIRKEPGTIKFNMGFGKIPLVWTGHFSLSAPNKGWPVGKYRVDLLVDDQLIKSLKFTIQ